MSVMFKYGLVDSKRAIIAMAARARTYAVANEKEIAAEATYIQFLKTRNTF